MFVDEVTITVTGGRGGNGRVSFHREKYIPRGGPDGGDGGKGGAVIIVAQEGMTTLLDVAKRREYKAKDGSPGGGNNRHGRSAGDIVIRVPCGTLVKNAATGEILRDLKGHEERTVIARGGGGGRGNAYFASSTNQTPRHAQKGKPGESRGILLELKLLADVGVVGLPNSGKSTLLSHVSDARPKIADYPFTTKTPHLGIVELERYRRFVMADIPGLIEGAHRGMGLGDEFLKHIERTRLIVHLIDIAPLSGPAPAEAYKIIRNELASHSKALAEKPEIVVANKMDLSGAEQNLRKLRRKLGIEVIGISAVTGKNLKNLLKRIAEMLWPAQE